MQLSLFIFTLSFAFSNQIADVLDVVQPTFQDHKYGLLNEITDFDSFKHS